MREIDYRAVVDKIVEEAKADRMTNLSSARIPLHAEVTARQIRQIYDLAFELDERLKRIENEQ